VNELVFVLPLSLLPGMSCYDLMLLHFLASLLVQLHSFFFPSFPFIRTPCQP